MNQLRESFNQFVQTELNKEQQSAVTSTQEALLVIAGAGSGKTRVITARMLNLILNAQVDPRSIVALTFTNKAAGEMRERMVKFLGESARLPFIGTFHAYCLLLLRANTDLLPFPSFSILDADDQLALIKRIIKDSQAEKNFTASQILYQLSNLKNSKNTLDKFPPSESRNTKLMQEIYHKYEAEKASSHLLDFDDLILHVLNLFEKNSTFQENFQRKIKHILIDEYQDTSTVQHTLLKKMALDKDNNYILDSLCAVGDEDQSIYSWRGANVTNMLRFSQDFAPVRIIKLEQNYRSAEPILQAANSLITNNKLRNPKTLWSTRTGSQRILNLICRSGEQEAEAIALLIKSLPTNITNNEVAILYRTHFQSRAIEEALIYHAIPYKIVGGTRFYERKEIKDLLAYLRLLVNPYDKISFLRILNTPTRGLGKKIETMILDLWQVHPFSSYQELITILLETMGHECSTAHKNSLYALTELLTNCGKQELPSDILASILEKTNYSSYLRETLDPQEADSKIENIQELVRAIYSFETNLQSSKTTLELMNGEPLTHDSPLDAFLHEVTLMQEKNNADDSSTQINMMTLHAAKGLEFKVVIMTGLEEGILPSTKSLNTNEELEEERRLMYVGITRAKDYLLLMHAHNRTTYGQFLDQVKSRFMREIDTKLYEQIDIEALHPAKVKAILTQWLGNQRIASIITPQAAQARIIQKHEIPTPAVVTLSTTNAWAKNQKVMHKKFGMGIITDVEKISESEFYITAIFKLGKKKILSNFLEKPNK